MTPQGTSSARRFQEFRSAYRNAELQQVAAGKEQAGRAQLRDLPHAGSSALGRVSTCSAPSAAGSGASTGMHMEACGSGARSQPGRGPTIDPARGVNASWGTELLRALVRLDAMNAA